MTCYNKHNTQLLVDMEFLFPHSTWYMYLKVQLTHDFSSWRQQEKFHVYAHSCRLTWPLTEGLQILLPQSCSHQINIKTEYKKHEISMHLSFFKNCSLIMHRLQHCSTAVAVVIHQLQHCDTAVAAVVIHQLRHCGTAVAVLQHTRTSSFNWTVGARNFCRSKWTRYSAIAPSCILLHVTPYFLIISILFCLL